MAFKLPKYTELTDEQKIIVNLGYEKNILVSAAPGTGKTVIAIYRANQLSDLGRKVAMLVYNRPLMLYLESTIKSMGIKAEVNTWHSWLVAFYKDKFDSKHPREDHEDPFSYNWTRIRMDFERWGARNASRKYETVIIDEAQDVPIQFIQALKHVTKTITCLMDPQQSIESSRKTDIADVAAELGVRTAYTMYQNFRNHEEIYRFAQIYRKSDNDPRSPINELPHLIKYTTHGLPFSKVCDIIRRRKLPYVGVFVNHKQLNKTYEELSAAFPGRVYIYKSRRSNELSFDKEGIYVLSYNCMKGLEFDQVIMPRFDHMDASGDANTDTNLVYVSVTRASHYFYGFYTDTDQKIGYIDVMKPFRTGTASKSIVKWE